MLEKNGTIALTENDLKEYNSGNVSQRVKDSWGLSIDELKEVIEKESYTKIDPASGSTE
jgi:hypothetical protein